MANASSQVSTHSRTPNEMLGRHHLFATKNLSRILDASYQVPDPARLLTALALTRTQPSSEAFVQVVKPEIFDPTH